MVGWNLTQRAHISGSQSKSNYQHKNGGGAHHQTYIRVDLTQSYLCKHRDEAGKQHGKQGITHPGLHCFNLISHKKMVNNTHHALCPWQDLNFLPLPHGHGSFLPTVFSALTGICLGRSCVCSYSGPPPENWGIGVEETCSERDVLI